MWALSPPPPGLGLDLGHSASRSLTSVLGPCAIRRFLLLALVVADHKNCAASWGMPLGWQVGGARLSRAGWRTWDWVSTGSAS